MTAQRAVFPFLFWNFAKSFFIDKNFIPVHAGARPNHLSAPSRGISKRAKGIVLKVADSPLENHAAAQQKTIRSAKSKICSKLHSRYYAFGEVMEGLADKSGQEPAGMVVT